MLMANSNVERNGHEQRRDSSPTHSTCLSSRLGLVCRTHRLDPAAPDGASEAKALQSHATDESSGVLGRHLGWVKALAGHTCACAAGASVSLAAHPLDKDQAVAEAWTQPGWADYSGVSRTLSGLSWDEARQIASVLEQMNQPYIQAELQLLRSQGKRICLDGDLTGIPVSNTSRTYPNAAYGHMDDDIRLGYQAGVVSLGSPTYGRLWLSIAHHPGDTVSCTQAEALVLAAEARLVRRRGRRTDLLRQRMQAFEAQTAQTIQRLEIQQRAVERARERLAESEQQYQARQQQLREYSVIPFD